MSRCQDLGYYDEVGELVNAAAELLTEVERLREELDDIEAGGRMFANAAMRYKEERDHHRKTLRLIAPLVKMLCSNTLRYREPWLFEGGNK